MLSHDRAPAAGGIQNPDAGRAQADVQTSSGIAGRDAVVGLPHADPGLGIDPARQDRCHIERLARQQGEHRQLAGRRLADRLRSRTERVAKNVWRVTAGPAYWRRSAPEIDDLLPHPGGG